VCSHSLKSRSKTRSTVDENKNLTTRLDRAGFDDAHTLEDFEWDSGVTFDRDLFGLLDRHEGAPFLGPTGVGETFLAPALSHSVRIPSEVGHRFRSKWATQTD